MKRLLRNNPALLLLLVLALSCDSAGPEEPGIAGRFSGTIPGMASVLSLSLTETEGVVSGIGLLTLTLNDREIKYSFTVGGTVTGRDFLLRWAYSRTGIVDTYEGRMDGATNLSGTFRRKDFTVEFVLLKRE